MIFKISLPRSRAPFKVLYIASEEGIEDLAEAYQSGLLLKDTSLLKHWVSLDLKKELSQVADTYVYKQRGQSHEEFEEALKAKDLEVKRLREAIINKGKEIDSVLSKLGEETPFIWVPLLKKSNGTIRYLINPDSPRGKYLKSLDNNNKNTSIYHRMYSYSKDALLGASKKEHIKTISLIEEGENKGHPCTLCTAFLEMVEGGCSFGGPSCKDNLSNSLKKGEI